MHSSGISHTAIGRQLRYHHKVVSSLLTKYEQTDDVNDLWPSVMPQHEDRTLHHIVQRHTFSLIPALMKQWPPNGQVSYRTLRNRLKSAGCAPRRVVKHSLLTNRHQRACFGVVLRTSDLEPEDMDDDPLAGRKLVPTARN